MPGVYLDAARASTLIGVRVSLAWCAEGLVDSTSNRDVTFFSWLAVDAGINGDRALWCRVLCSFAIFATRFDSQTYRVAPLTRPASFAFKLSILVLVLAWFTRVTCCEGAGTGGDETCKAFVASK